MRHKIIKKSNRRAFDVEQNFTIQRSVEELNNLNEIKRTAALGITLPMNGNNEAMLEDFTTPAIFGNEYSPVDVEVWAGHVKLPFETLQVRKSSDRDRSFDAELLDKSLHWIEQAKETKLADLDFGQFTFTEADVLNNMQFNTRWEPGDALYHFPLVDYGNSGGRFKFNSNDIDEQTAEIRLDNHGLPTAQYFGLLVESDNQLPDGLITGNVHPFFVTSPNHIRSAFFSSYNSKGNGDHYLTLGRWRLHELRPLVSVPGLLITAFEQMGWTLRGDVLYHEDFQKAWQYILAKDYYDNDAIKDYTYVEATANSDQIVGAGSTIIFNNEVKDDSNSWNPLPSQSMYEKQVTGNLKVKVTASIIVQNLSGSPRTFSIAAVYDGTPPKRTFTIAGSTTQTFTYEAEFEMTGGLGSFFFLNILTTNPLTVKAGSSIIVETGEYRGLFLGATYPLNQLLHPDYTVFDAFSGFVHLGDFKLQTNFDTKEVTVFASENTDFNGIDLEGFYRPLSEVKDMSNYIETGSREVLPRNEERPRYIRLKFKDSTDDYIKQVLKETAEEPTHSRTIDLGSKYKDDTLDIENPFYEPTEERRVGNVIVPVMWDNNDARASFSIKPRIVWSAGFVRQHFAFGQVLADDTTVINMNETQYFLEDTEYFISTYCSQLPKAKLWDGTTETTTNRNLVYGVTDNDLFVNFWDIARFRAANLPEFGFLARLTLEQFLSEDFRKRWLLDYAGERYPYKLSRMYGHETGNDNSTEVILIPEP